MTNLDVTQKNLLSKSVGLHQDQRNAYVDWRAILGGAFISAAIFTSLMTFGAAVGLSAVSPFASKGLSATAVGVAAACWLLWVTISSFVVGAYLAGRLSQPVHDSNENESEVRDGAHGLIVWAIGGVLIAWLATASVTGLAKGASTVASTPAAKLLEAHDPVNYAIDRMWRSASSAVVISDAERQAASRILATSYESGSISSEDKIFLTALVAARASVPQDEAARRIEASVKDINVAVAKAKEAAETGRKLGVIVAFLTAASLAIGAAAAWWAARLGGTHRNDGVAFDHLFALR